MTPNNILIRASIIFTCLVTVAQAFEPYNVGHKPEEINAFDHLEPVARAVPEFRYLAQYWTESDHEAPRYVVLVNDEPSGRYYVEQGTPPKCERILDRQYHFKKRVQISSETADIIHEFWVNVLLETRYDRKGLSVVVLGGETRTFSTFVWNLGWLHGFTWESVRDDLPPNWICDAGEALFSFATKTQRDETELRNRITADRDKFYQYLKAHPSP